MVQRRYTVKKGRFVVIKAELSRQEADELYKVANREFGGNVEEAVEEAIRLLVMSRKVS